MCDGFPKVFIQRFGEVNGIRKLVLNEVNNFLNVLLHVKRVLSKRFVQWFYDGVHKEMSPGEVKCFKKNCNGFLCLAIGVGFDCQWILKRSGVIMPILKKFQHPEEDAEQALNQNF